jgi:hypothetical protein
MQCTIVCDCGRSITVDRNDRNAECPGCYASYAVTITQLQKGKESLESR